MFYTKRIWLLIWYIYKFKRVNKKFFFFFFYERASAINFFFSFFPVYIHNGLNQRIYIHKNYRIGNKLGKFFKTRNL